MNIKNIVRIVLITFIIVVVLIGCDSTNYALIICESSYDGKILESDMACTLTYYVYYDNKVVKELNIIEEYKLKGGSIEDLIWFSESTDYTFNQDHFNVKGFTYSSELNDANFIIQMTLDYSLLDVNSISDDVKGFFFAEQMIDEHNSVSLDKLIDYYSVLGFECKEVS